MQTFIKNGGRFGSAPLGYDHFGPRVKKKDSSIQNKDLKSIKQEKYSKMPGNGKQVDYIMMYK
jgi:hypothetical protein